MHYRNLWLAAWTLALLPWSAQAEEPPPLKIELGGNPLDGASLDFSLDGKTLRCSIDGWKKDVAFFPELWETRYWDPASGKECKGPQGDYRDAVSPDGKYAFTKDGGAGRVVDRTTGKEFIRIELPDGFHISGPSLFAPDGKSLIVTISNADLKNPPPPLPSHDRLALFETTTGKLIRSYGAGPQVEAAAFSPDGKTLYANQLGLPGGGFLFFALDLDKDQAADMGRYFLPGRNRPSPDGTAMGVDARPSPDGKLLAVLGAVEQDRDSVLHLFDATTGKKRGEIKGHVVSAEVFAKPSGDPVTINRSGILCFAFAPDGKTIATGGEDGAVCVWDVGAAKVLSQSMIHRPGNGKAVVLSVAFSPDGRRIASIDDKGMVYVWDAPR